MRTFKTRETLQNLLKDNKGTLVFTSETLGSLHVFPNVDKDALGKDRTYLAVHGDSEAVTTVYEPITDREGKQKQVKDGEGEPVPAFKQTKKRGDKRKPFFRTDRCNDAYVVLYEVDGEWHKEQPADIAKVSDVAVITRSIGKSDKASYGSFRMSGGSLVDDRTKLAELFANATA